MNEQERLQVLLNLAGVTRAELAALPVREEWIIRRVFGVGSDPWTLDEIAARFRVSRERVRQISLKGLRRLRNGEHLARLSTWRDPDELAAEVEAREQARAREIATMHDAVPVALDPAPVPRSDFWSQVWQLFASMMSAGAAQGEAK